MNLARRTVEPVLEKYLLPGKVLILYGPRRVGKTTLINQLIEKNKHVSILLRAEEKVTQEAFSSLESYKMKNLVGENKFVFIDEAQKIKNIGENLKLFIDTFPEIAVLASGSSSFDLARKIGEPLTGRQNVIILYPFSQKELINYWGRVRALSSLEEILIYGSYPEVINFSLAEDKKNYLDELIHSYLYKDILEFDSVKNSGKIFDLLSLVAYQIGNEVSVTELSRQLEISKNTVTRYLDLLEKAFVLIKVRGFSRNLRSEITNNCRYYFWDNGVRNALISNFNPLARRADTGQLWENYLAVERTKKQSYDPLFANNFFWRTYGQQEIDWVEEREGKLFGYEFKWQKNKGKKPALWTNTYPNAEFEIINKDNYLDFVI